jgi:hypothetical protein
VWGTQYAQKREKVLYKPPTSKLSSKVWETNEHLHEQGVCHAMALPFTLKRIARQKEELWKLKNFITQKYNLQKIL